ncbi:MAG: hypothetical protein PHN34_08295, partial [Kiritimatiellae bacterium]|nr:hypothetical protein [Kiritimatiellia bacterium]
MKQKLILIISVVIGLFAAFLTRSYLTAKDNEIARMKADFYSRNKKIAVIGAKRAIPSGTILTMEDIGGFEVLESAVKDHAVRTEDILLLLNRKTVRALSADAPIFWTDIEGGDPSSRGLAADIKQRMRAISVNVS